MNKVLRTLLVFLLADSIFLIQAYLVNYHFHQENDAEVKKCISSAIERISDETCVIFQHNPKARDAIFFLESTRCGWQQNNSTVHLSADCLNEDRCTEFVHHAIAGERQHHSSIVRYLNTKFNCTDKCTTACENGGSVNADCTCKCAYGFSGTHCENLKLANQFTDSSCGLIKASGHGVLSLNGRNDKSTFCQWVVTAADPWAHYELEFMDVDLDGENMPPGQRCADQLYVYGVKGMLNPIPCDVPGGSHLIGSKFLSDSNWLFIEYRGSPLSSRPHKGPVIKYRAVSPPPHNSDDISSYIYEHVTAGSSPPLQERIWSVLLLLPVLLLNQLIR